MRNRMCLTAILAVACQGPPTARGQGADDALRVPAGFKIAVYADKLHGVRYLALGPGHAVYASQPGSGLIVKLTDANQDGVADNVVTVASGLSGPFGIAFRGDTMYGIYHEALGQLFEKEKDALEVMKWKEVYDKLEQTLDEAEDVANVIESITLKHA